jgi:translation initiation factor eIF-2B subunit alpha
MRTHQVLTAAGIPCTVVLDSAVAYIMERVDMVLVGSEAVVESGVSLLTPVRAHRLTPQGLVSSIGTYQVALVAKAHQIPFYALAESYKFLRHYPLSQTDLPMPRPPPGEKATVPPLTFLSYVSPRQPQAQPMGNGDSTTPHAPGTPRSGGSGCSVQSTRMEMSAEMEKINPTVDVTTPDLIDFIITDLGAPLSPTSVSQYLVAQFSS